MMASDNDKMPNGASKPEERIGDDDNASLSMLRFSTLKVVLYVLGVFYLSFLGIIIAAHTFYQTPVSTEVVILMTLPGYVITTIVGVIAGSAIDR